MPRQLRYFIPGIPQHVIARGVDRQAVFFQEQDYKHYLAVLKEAAAANQCAVHAYVLMTNQLHVVATPGQARKLFRHRAQCDVVFRCYGVSSLTPKIYAVFYARKARNPARQMTKLFPYNSQNRSLMPEL